MLKLALILCLALLAAGCVSAAWKDVLKSKDTYKACLAANPDNPDKCESLRRAYEADFQAYEGVWNRGTISIEEKDRATISIEKKDKGEVP